MERPAPTSGPSVLVTDEQWKLVWSQLRLHVHRKYRWFSLKTGRDLNGYVHQALIAVMSGKLQYPPVDLETGLEKDVTLLAFLCKTVRRLILDELDILRRLDQLDDTLPLQAVTDPRKSYLLRQVKVEDKIRFKALVTTMRELVKDEPLLDLMVQVWAREPELKPREMATVLDLEMSQMRAAQKRLRRRLERLREELR